MKRKEKRKQQQEKGERDTDELIQALERSALSEPLPGCGTASPGVSPSTSPGDAPASERSRRLKNLRKKLRQVEELQQRLDAGEVPNPTREQLEKLSRRKTLEEELRGRVGTVVPAVGNVAALGHFSLYLFICYFILFGGVSSCVPPSSPAPRVPCHGLFPPLFQTVVTINPAEPQRWSLLVHGGGLWEPHGRVRPPPTMGLRLWGKLERLVPWQYLGRSYKNRCGALF